MGRFAMLPLYFVNVTGNIEVDPLDRWCENFLSMDGAISFMRVWLNKGYGVRLYKGEYITSHPDIIP